MRISLYLHEGSSHAREHAESVEEAIELLKLLWSLGWRSVEMTLPRERFRLVSFSGTIDDAIALLGEPALVREAAADLPVVGATRTVP